MLSRLLTTAAILLLAVSCALSQTTTTVTHTTAGPTAKGNWLLNGAISYSYQSGKLYEDDNGNGYSSLSVYPTVGYYLLDGLQIALDMEYASGSQGDLESHLIGFGPSVAYYFGGHKPGAKAKGSLIPFVSTGFFYYHVTSKFVFTSSWMESKYTYTSVSNRIGVCYMVSDAVALEGTALLSHAWRKQTTTSPGITQERDREPGYYFTLGLGFGYFIW